MKDRLKKSLRSTKDYVESHKLAVAATVVAITAIALQQANRKAFYKFLEDEGIDPMKYYCPEYYDELNP